MTDYNDKPPCIEREIGPIDVKGYFYASGVHASGCYASGLLRKGIVVPYCILLHGTEDVFLPIYETMEKFNAGLEWCEEHFSCGARLFVDQITSEEHLGQIVEQVRSLGAVLGSNQQANVRVMIDPEFISSTHTRWREMKPDGGYEISRNLKDVK